jgi:hypothetical protein
MKKILLLLAGVSLIGIVYAQGPITIKKASKAAKIDGIADSNDPWNTGGITWINMTQNKPSTTTSDITAKFQLTFDNSYLYLLCKVMGDKTLDTASSEIPNSYENDCIEVFLKMDTSSGESGAYIPGDFQFRMRRASIFPDRFDAGQLIAGWADNGNFKIAQVESDGSYTQEWQMPWALLADSSCMDPVWDMKQFKFDIQVADNTTGAANGRTQQLFWNSGSDEQWHNTTYLGLVTMEVPCKKKSSECGLDYVISRKKSSSCSNKVKKTIISEIELFPNPASSSLTVNIPERMLNSKLNILNLEGQIVYTDILKSTSNTISLNPLKQGIYFVKITGADATVTKKIIKN